MGDKLRLTPMQYANQFAAAKARAKQYDKWAKECRAEADTLEGIVLDLIENEELPSSFKSTRGASVFTSDETWASPRDGDHQRLARVLESLGMTELLPKSVNSQSLSGWVREFRNELGEVVIQDEEHPEGLPREVADVLKITQRTRVKVNGL